MSHSVSHKAVDQSAPVSNQPVPLLDMGRHYNPLRDEILSAIERVCASGHFVLGPECQALEQSLAAYCHVPHAVGCASGSDALLLALIACGIGPGDEVIVPSYTFFATASAPWRLGAKVVFVDIEPETFNVNPTLLAQHISPATRAIIPVHLYGQCADMDPILDLGAKHGLAVIEDAAQAIGAEHRGRRAGSMGDVGCLSFYPTKNLGGCGDGGMLTTRRDDLAHALRLLRAHGMEPRYYHQVVGINSRLDAIQAAVLNVKFKHLNRWTQDRRLNAQRYAEIFKSYGLDEMLVLPREAANRRHVWNQYIVRIPEGRRDALREHLRQRQVATEIYYPVPLHEQECFRGLGYRKGSLPETERAARETLALPIFPELTVAEQETVVGHIAQYFGVARITGGHSQGGPHFRPKSAA